MTTLVCPVCSARWKIVPEGEGDRPAVCPVCKDAGVIAPHWRNGGMEPVLDAQPGPPNA